MATMHCDIVSAEREIFSGQVTMVVATGTIGELGILPGHAPLLTGVRPGPIRLRLDSGVEEVFFASGGYLEVQPNHVTILADTALRAEDLDEVAAQQAKEQAERALIDRAADLDHAAVAAMLAEAIAQLRVLAELRRERH